MGVIGTISLKAKDPEALEILSVRKTNKLKDKLILPDDDFSLAEFLRKNLNKNLSISFKDLPTISGTVKWVAEGEAADKAVIELIDGRDKLIKLTDIIGVEIYLDPESESKK